MQIWVNTNDTLIYTHYTKTGAWSSPDSTPYVIGQCIYVYTFYTYACHYTYIYNTYYVHILQHIYIITFLFMSMCPYYMSTTYNRTLWIDCLCMKVVCLWLFDGSSLYCAIVQIYIMALITYDANTIHFHMNFVWSVALGQSYITHHHYLVVQCWIWATLLHPMIITLVGAPNVWRYVWIFIGMVVCMLNDTNWYHITVILYILFPHVTMAFPLFWPVFWIILLSIDNMHICTVRWVLACYCSSTMPSL